MAQIFSSSEELKKSVHSLRYGLIFSKEKEQVRVDRLFFADSLKSKNQK